MQREKIKSKAKENGQRITQQIRQNPKSRNKQKRTIRNRNISKNSYANVNLFTTNYLNPISSLNREFALQEGIFYNGNNINKIIKDIYPIIENKCSNLFLKADLSDNISNIEFLEWILKMYENSLEHEEIWTIDLDANNNYTIYHLHDFDDVGIKGRSAPINWLLDIKKQNYNLFELFIAFLHNMYESIKCPMYYNCDKILDAIEFLKEDIYEIVDDEPEKADNIKTWINIYKNGAAKELEAEIRCCTIEVENFEHRLKNFKAKTPRDKQLIKFLKKHKHLIYHKDTLSMFYHSGYTTKGYEEESNSYFDIYAQIIFSYDDEDEVFKLVEQTYSDYANEYGVVPFRQLIDVSKNEKVSDLPSLYVNMLDDLNKL